MEFDSLFVKEYVLIRVVEHLAPQHNEARVMAPSQADVVEIVEADAELGLDQGVGRGLQFSSHAVWLEAEDAGCHVVHVVAPAGHHWIALYGVTWNSRCCERALICLPGLCVGQLLALATDSCTLSNESILTHTAIDIHI